MGSCCEEGIISYVNLAIPCGPIGVVNTDINWPYSDFGVISDNFPNLGENCYTILDVRFIGTPNESGVINEDNLYIDCDSCPDLDPCPSQTPTLTPTITNTPTVTITQTNIISEQFWRVEGCCDCLET